MNPEILKFCMERGVLVDRETFSVLSSLGNDIAKGIIERVSGLKEKVLTKAFFQSNQEIIKELIGDEKIIEKIKLNFGLSLEISREKIIEKPKKEDKQFENLKVISSHVSLSRKISPGDFVKYFRNRYSEIRQILMQRKELENLTSINKISNDRQNISIIGMVFSKRVTKNKNIILDIEDLTGRINVMVNHDKQELYEKAKSVIIDDIIGIKGMVSSKGTFGKMIFTTDFYYPDSHIDKNNLEREELVAFTSDIHVGSVNFLEENFLKFIKWLNGSEGTEQQREEARKVKYLFITGDTIDGVGVYPGQEELLNIKDIREQYKKLAEILGTIRKDVIIIICPGQHDSVRVAEPQPPIGRDYGEALHELDNVIFVSNPALIEIKNGNKKGFKILMYHGASMTPYINEIEYLRIAKAHHNPSKVVKEILKRRHLASIHSSVTYIPFDKYDPLIIKEVPDVMNTGDFHRTDVDSYNGVLIICSSCWQSITPFEEKVGNIPDPCKVPILNLKTRAVKILDFTSKEESEVKKLPKNLLSPQQATEYLPQIFSPSATGNFSLRENPSGFSSPEKSTHQDFSGSKSVTVSWGVLNPDLEIKKEETV